MTVTVHAAAALSAPGQWLQWLMILPLQVRNIILVDDVLATLTALAALPPPED